MSTPSELLERLRAAEDWPQECDAMRAVRAAAAEGVEGLDLLLEALAGWLRAGDEWPAAEAAKTLGVLADPRSVDALLGAIAAYPPMELPEDLGSGDRNHAILAHAMVSNDEDDVRYEAIEALGRIGDRRAAPALRAVLAHPAEVKRVKQVARAVLERLEEGSSQ